MDLRKGVRILQRHRQLYICIAAVLVVFTLAAWIPSVGVWVLTTDPVFQTHSNRSSRKTLPQNSRGVTHVFIVVKSLPSAVGRRDVLRATWLPVLAEGNITYRFFTEKAPLGGRKTLAREAALYGDMVQLNELEVQRHRQLGRKMVESFRWIDEHWDTQFVAVVDDDTYVWPETLMRDVRTSWHGPMMYLGRHMPNMAVIHVPDGQEMGNNTKYGERRYPARYFPNYASGVFFALSVDLLQPFINPVVPLRVMTSNDAMVGTVLLPYDVRYESRTNILPWGHKNTSLCIKPESFYAIHTTPEYLESWHTYEMMILNLHQNLTAGKCIRGFSNHLQ
jgi:Galactosyltransferase